MVSAFDASIDLTDSRLPAGLSWLDAISRVRAAVEALPGANWVDVEWVGSAPASLEWLRVYQPGHAAVRDDADFRQIRGRIVAAVAAPLLA